MRRFNGLDIEVTKGDTLIFKINFQGQQLSPNTIALFTVKKKPRDEEVVIEKRNTIVDGATIVTLSSDDTDINARTYFWDIRVLIPLGDGSYRVQTPMEFASFTILEAIGNV